MQSHMDIIYTLLQFCSTTDISRWTRVCRQWRRVGWRILLKERFITRSGAPTKIPYIITEPDGCRFSASPQFIVIYNKRPLIVIHYLEGHGWFSDYKDVPDNHFLFHMEIWSEAIGYKGLDE